MTIPPITSGGVGSSPFRVPALTAPVSTGVPPVVGDDDAIQPQRPQATSPDRAQRDDAPITLAGRLDQGDTLPDTTELALALESATRAMQNGRADQVLSALDAVWSDQLAADSPWYLRTAALQLLGRMGDAEQVMRDAITRLPRSAALLYLLGVHTAHRGQTEAARLANDHALALHPTEPLLWLQRAALTRADMPGTADAILDNVLAMEPHFPAAHWLTTLLRLGDASRAERGDPDSRTLSRRTPAWSAGIDDGMGDATVQTPTISLLETAVRYGLTLLQSPTQSARTATSAAAVPDSAVAATALITKAAPHDALPPAALGWEPVVVGVCIVAFVLVPALRVPALIIGGAAALMLASRRLV